MAIAPTDHYGIIYEKNDEFHVEWFPTQGAAEFEAKSVLNEGRALFVSVVNRIDYLVTEPVSLMAPKDGRQP